MRKEILEISRKLEAHYIDAETAKGELLNLFSVSQQSGLLKCDCGSTSLEDNPLNPNTKRCLSCLNVVAF